MISSFIIGGCSSKSFIPFCFLFPPPPRFFAPLPAGLGFHLPHTTTASLSPPCPLSSARFTAHTRAIPTPTTTAPGGSTLSIPAQIFTLRVSLAKRTPVAPFTTRPRRKHPPLVR